ncbi:MAG: dTDP-4-dehydrorhamnose 3,5-epimerase [Myxococcales bacterium]|nr:MAG: dTDP-4-dehydrorhamnose 3,5-epimerase [Myxococcales bacterium]
MQFTETRLPGAYLIDPEPIEDERGYFVTDWTRAELEARHLNAGLIQGNLSYNAKRGTLRGLHFQVAPYAEVKLVRCLRGALWDVIVDLRPDSPTFKQWTPVELSAANRRLLYVPEGFAHGYVTLEDHTEVMYLVSQYYHPEAARGLRWDDPAFGIPWPIPPACISARDRAHPLFEK